MNNKIDFDDILIEWGYRVHNGQPNPKDTNHLYHLSQILYENGWPYQVVEGLIQNLLEQETKFKGRTKDGDLRYYKTKDALDKALEKGTVEPVDDKETEKDTSNLVTKKGVDAQLAGDRDAKPGDVTGDDSKKDKEKSKAEKKPRGDEESKQNHIKNGFVKGAAPGNPGSMYNEIISGEVANLIRENPDMSDEELTKAIIEKHGESKLAKQNDGKTRAGGLKKGEVPDIEGVSQGLISKTLIAVRSGRRKAERAKQAENELGFKNTTTDEYFGDKIGLEKQREAVRNAEKIVNLDGEEISQQEMLDLIDSSGSGDNPSDTTTIITNEDGTITVLFTSDKDSLDAIISQSSAKAESKQTDDAILKLVDSGQLTKEEAEAIAGERRNFADKKEETERKLKEVTNRPVDFLQENVDTEMIEKAKTTRDTKKHFQNEVVNRFQPGKAIRPTPAFDDDGNKIEGGQKHKVEDYLKQVGWKEGEEPTEEQQFKAFLLFAKKAQNPPANTQKLIQRMNTQNDGPNVSEEIENIRKEVIKDEQEHIDFLNEREIEVGGEKVKLGNYVEGNNIYKQGHMGAIDGEQGVHKHRGMFEVNNAGTTITGETFKKILGIDNKKQFLQRFEVVDAVEQIGVSGRQKGRTTGSTRIVYAVMVDEQGETSRVPIMEKRQRSKDGELGKLQTVYKWTKELQDRIKENQ